MSKLHRILVLLVAIGIISSLALSAQRYRTEMRNRRVQLVADWDQLQTLSLATGRPMAGVLSALKSEGITGIAVTEQTLGMLRDSGQIGIRAQSDGTTRLAVPSPELGSRILRQLQAKYGAGFATAPEGMRFPGEIRIQASWVQLSNVGVGLPEDVVSRLQSRSNGFEVIARLQNSPGARPDTIAWDLEQVRRLGIRRVIFAADQVLGFSGLTKETAEQFEQKGLYYGSVEFGKQKGDDKLSLELAGRNTIRVHSIASAEIWNLDPRSAVDRYIRAARERNIRLLYVRLYDAADENPLESQREYVRAIVTGLRSAGMEIGPARPFEAPRRPLALVVLAGIGVAAGALLLLKALFPIPLRWMWALTFLGAAVAAAMVVVGGSLGVRLLALLAALVFPILAFAAVRFPDGGEALSAGVAFRRGIPLLAAITGISLLGAVFVVGLLSDILFMLKIKQFMGIKVAHLIPVLAILAVLIGDIRNDGQPWEAQKKRIVDNFARFFGQPMLIWQILALGAALGIAALLVLRSGNDPGVGVSDFELKVRALLDRIFFVRPRTKEFLVGHPALLAGITFTLAGRRRWVVPLLVLGSIGQVSVINTFCHIHTPLALSGIRIINGLVLGSVVGLVATALYARFVVPIVPRKRPENKAHAAASERH